MNTKQLKEEIEKWHKAYKDWNDKKLSDIERDKAQSYLDDGCDNDWTISEMKAQLQARQQAFKDVEKVIDEFAKEHLYECSDEESNDMGIKQSGVISDLDIKELKKELEKVK